MPVSPPEWSEFVYVGAGWCIIVLISLWTLRIQWRSQKQASRANRSNKLTEMMSKTLLLPQKVTSDCPTRRRRGAVPEGVHRLPRHGREHPAARSHPLHEGSREEWSCHGGRDIQHHVLREGEDAGLWREMHPERAVHLRAPATRGWHQDASRVRQIASRERVAKDRSRHGVIQLKKTNEETRRCYLLARSPVRFLGCWESRGRICHLDGLLITFLTNVCLFVFRNFCLF